MTDERRALGRQTMQNRAFVGRVVAGSLLFGGILFGFGMTGLFVGAMIGGNLAVDFQFAGNRGYEATGVLGAGIGIAAGIVLGAIAVACRICNCARK